MSEIMIMVIFADMLTSTQQMGEQAGSRDMTSVKVSVVIPVYNKKDYVEGCLRSVMTQDFDGYEAIAVDDGSTDGSADVCERMAHDYPRLRVIHQTNGGVTAARRHGVALAEGEYIMFVDADDTLRPGSIGILHKAIVATGADEVVATFHDQHGRHHDSGFRGTANTAWMMRQLLGCKSHFPILWGVIFRKTMLEGCLSAPPIIREGEDILMQVMFLMNDPKVVFIPDSVYNYVAGLPNNRRLNLPEQRVYDETLRQVLEPKWQLYKDLYTLRQLKTYENFIAARHFDVYDEYYYQARERLNGNIPVADRIAITLPPRVAYWLIRLRKSLLRLSLPGIHN